MIPLEINKPTIQAITSFENRKKKNVTSEWISEDDSFLIGKNHEEDLVTLYNNGTKWFAAVSFCKLPTELSLIEKEILD